MKCTAFASIAYSLLTEETKITSDRKQAQEVGKQQVQHQAAHSS